MKTIKKTKIAVAVIACCIWGKATSQFICIAYFLFVLILSGLYTANCFAQVSITTTGAPPDASAMLDIVSTNRGVLIPRMTTTERDAIASPILSLMIFNITDSCLQIYSFGSWEDIYCPKDVGGGGFVICGDSVEDVEGNWYQTILIGSQCWMQQNMRTATYPDGSPIKKGPTATGTGLWPFDSAMYSCPPDAVSNVEDCAAAASLGMLYQWSAAMDGSTSGAQGICPTGWHVATDGDWKTVEGSLGMSVAQQNATLWRGTNEGPKMADHATDQNWDCCVLTNDPDFATSGLKISPTGYRSASSGNYLGRGSAYLWTGTEDGTNAFRRRVNFLKLTVYRQTKGKRFIYAIRCVLD